MSKRMARMKEFLNKYEIGDAVFSKEELECISIFMHPHPSDLVCCGNCLYSNEGYCDVIHEEIESWKVCNEWTYDQFKYEDREANHD